MTIAATPPDLLDAPLAALPLSRRAARLCTHLGASTVRQFLVLPRERAAGAGRHGERAYDEAARTVADWFAHRLHGEPAGDDRPIAPLIKRGAVAKALEQLGVRTVAQFLATPMERVLQFPGVGERTWQRIADSIRQSAVPAAVPTALLPETLRALPLRHAALAAPLLAELEDLGCRTIGHAFGLPPASWRQGGRPGPEGAAALRASLDQMFRAAIEQVDAQAAPAADVDWPTLRGRLLAPLDDGDRELFCCRIGLDTPVRSAREQAAAMHRPLETVIEHEQSIRARLDERAPSLMCRLKHEATRELEAFEGVLRGDRLAAGSLLHTIAKGSGDRDLPVRLLAFCWPVDFHDHGGCLSALPASARLVFARELRALTAPRFLPRPLDELVQQLRPVVDPVPRGLLLHLLADRCRLRVHLEPGGIETVLPQQPEVSARLGELLHEAGRPRQLLDLVFDYRERFHSANRHRLIVHLRRDSTFVEIGPDLWSLRRWHDDELGAAKPRAEQVVVAVCERGARHAVRDLLGAADERTTHLVLDLVRRDRRVRWLGRGEICPAVHARSHVLDMLMTDFKRAQGEVVYSRFIKNQSTQHRRLVERLLRENRLFVFPSPDRIDVLTNYPFNPERLDRLLALVDTFLRDHDGYATLDAVLAEVNRCDLGGGWLHPVLLGELLRRHGNFEVLPGGYIARQERGLVGWLLRRARNALREAGVAISVQEILAERPELAEFQACLAGLLGSDPLVQTPDGVRYQIA